MHLNPVLRHSNAPILHSFRRFFEPPDSIDVVRRSSESRLHRVDGQMSRPEFFPLCDLLDPSLGRSLANRKSSFNTDAHGITSGFPRVRMNLCDRCLAGFVRPQLREPTVAEPSQTAQCTIVSASEPDWNGLLNRQRIQPRIGDLVPLAFKAH